MKYSFLWADDRELQVKRFVEKEPIYQEIKEKFTEFVINIDEVKNLPDRHVIGALEVRLGEKVKIYQTEEHKHRVCPNGK